ncbi:MAG: hypothetical protein HY674_00170 [Chloroflexi bacterium]|nr:hypothetical protein [Chloroflexota bacterium]
MKVWPEFNVEGDLPSGVHRATLDQIVQHFGTQTPQRILVGRRLQRIHALASRAGGVARFILFGSFVTAKLRPNDVDIFLLMEDSFDVNRVPAEAKTIFDHASARNQLGASIFWLRRAAALGGEEATIEHWQITRAGRRRGIVEVIPS